MIDVQAPLKVEAGVGLQALAGLEEDWNRLSESVEPRNAFMTYGWFKAWTRHGAAAMPEGRFEPHVLVVKRGDAVVGVSPLVRRVASGSGLRVRKLEFATSHADYNELVLGSDAAAQTDAVAGYLARRAEDWDVMELRDLRDTGDAGAGITNALKHHGLRFEMFPEGDGCPYLPMDGGAAEQSKRLSGHDRREMRRRSALAEAEGASMRMIEEPQKEPGLLAKLIELERKKHLRSEFPPFIGRHAEVFQELFDELGSRGWLYVAMLEAGEQPIAFQLGFRCGDLLWDYTKGHDHDYSRLAPGTLLLAGLLNYGFEEGYREYDFLRGEEPYKLQWSTGCHRRFRLLIWSPRWGSRLRKLIYHDLKEALRRPKAKLI